MQTRQRQIYLILGMARSGTSALARGLQALGINLGEHLTKGDQIWNPTGFWEDREIVYNINRALIYALNHPWMSIKLLPTFNPENNLVQKISIQAKHLLEQRFADSHYWGFKDPRTAKLLPFWQAIFQDLSLEEHYLFALRNPLSSAESYTKLSGGRLEEGLLLWLSHFIPALEHTQTKKRIVVSYELLLDNPQQQLERMRKSLGLPFIPDNAELNYYTREFIKPSLYHYRYQLEDLERHPAVQAVPLSARLYKLLIKAAKDELSLEESDFICEWQEIKQEFDKLYPLYAYLDDLLQENKGFEDQMKKLHRSLIWKLSAPFRWGNERLKYLREHLKVKKKLLSI